MSFYFSVIDTEAKVYLLGWISAVTGKRKREIHHHDCHILTMLRDAVHPEISITTAADDGCGFIFTIHFQKMMEDICNILYGTDLDWGCQYQILPENLSDELTWAFIRGLFDGGDDDSRPIRVPLATISSTSKYMKSQIGTFCGIPHHANEEGISFAGVNAIDFLSKIYDRADPNYRSSRKYELYLEYLGYGSGTRSDCGPAASTRGVPMCRCVKTTVNAISPSKANASDEGYDLWLIGVDKIISSDTTRYETGIKIQPEDGWHVELLPRSSLSNSGYMLANSIGLIDSSYRGTLKVALTKINPSAAAIVFPFKAVQMVLRRSIHYICEEVADFDEGITTTTRNEGGFGSTDKIEKIL